MSSIKAIHNTEVGAYVTFTGRLVDVEAKKTVAKLDYLDFKLADKGSEIQAKLWEASSNDIANFKNAKYVSVTGSITTFRGANQITLQSYRILNDDEVDVGEFTKIAPEPVSDLVKVIEQCIDDIEDRAIKEIVVRRWNKNKDAFIKYPAARGHHHNYPTGLLYHTVGMLRLAMNNLKQYPFVMDKDVLFGAIILHDMDKIREYDNPDNPQWSKLGNLYGHIFMSGAETYYESKILYEQNPEWDFSKVKYLIHAILAHHGKLEWGSPVTPQTMEAEIIHQIDMMDSRINSSKWV